MKSQMDTGWLEGMDLSNGMYTEHSAPLVDSMEGDSFGEPQTFPRIGEDHQVEIPELVKKSDYLSEENSSAEAETSSFKFLIGLPIPVTLVYLDNEDRSLKTAEDLEKLHFQMNVREPAGPVNILRDSLEKCQSKVNGSFSGESIDIALRKKSCDGPVYFLVPHSASQKWSDIEKESFLLGLYIFGKNFVQLKKFLETRTMEDIQSYYYGRFHQTQEYFRWSEWGRIKGKRCSVGHKIFTGLRQQELLSRVLRNVSEEVKHSVLEVSKMFGEGEMPFEEFVFSMKSLVGMNVLVEAVGIGKGKQDLTRKGLGHPKTSQGIPTRSEIPIGKDCSSLTCSEIVKYLSGDYRLSKARSNDLFWEAVWPRLLARGWHSEEPKDQAYAFGSKNALVFVVPGIKTFSRRKLIKGNHYFDSVSDVLNKIASEPDLLQLDNEKEESDKNGEECELNNEKSEEDDEPNQRRHCYLQPRTPNRGLDGMKFTVVDTSLGNGKPDQIRELRCLSVDIFNSFKSKSSVNIFCRDAPDTATDESDRDNVKLPSEDENSDPNASQAFLNGDVHCDVKILDISSPEQEMLDACPNSESIPLDDNTNRKIPSEDMKPKRAAQVESSQYMNEDNTENAAPARKRRRKLTACHGGQTSNMVADTFGVPAKLGPDIPTNVTMNPPKLPVKTGPESSSLGPVINHSVESIPSADVLFHDRLTLASPSNNSCNNSVECASAGNDHAAMEPQEAPRIQNMIDLNLPPVFDNGLSAAEETTDRGDNSSGPGYSNEPQISQDMTYSEQQSYMNTQRRSTRNRPPTARALEALASGYLTVNSRRKGKEGSSRDNSSSRPSRRARVGVQVSESETSPLVPAVQDSQRAESTESNGGEVSSTRSGWAPTFRTLGWGT